MLLLLAGMVAGCQNRTVDQASGGQKKERPQGSSGERGVIGRQDGGKPVRSEKTEAQRKEPPPTKAKPPASTAYQFPLVIKIESPEVPEAIRRPSPPIPKEPEKPRPKK